MFRLQTDGAQGICLILNCQELLGKVLESVAAKATLRDGDPRADLLMAGRLAMACRTEAACPAAL